MKSLVAVLLIIAAVLAVFPVPAEAFHWHYYHPMWGWGWWPHYAGPFYPPLVYLPPPMVQPPVIIQPQPQPYIQREPEQKPQEVVWYWCQKPAGFWPHVQQCEGHAWMKVLPSTAPPTAPK